MLARGPSPSCAPIPRSVYAMPEGVQRVIVWCFLGCVLERLANGYRACPGESMPRLWRPPVRSVRSETAERAIATGLVVPVASGLFGDAQAWVGPSAAVRQTTRVAA